MPAWPPIRRFGLSRVMTSTTCPVSTGKSPKILSSPPRKNISLSRSGKSVSNSARLTRREGRVAIVTNAGWDAVDAAASGASGLLQGGYSVSKTFARTTGDKSAFVDFGGRHMARRSADGGGCGRQNRVVLAPVAGAKPAEARSAQPGAARRQFAGDGDKTNSSPGRARHKPLKPLRRERRLIRSTCGDYRVHFFRTRAAGATGTRRSLRPPTFRARDDGHPPGRNSPRECGGVFGAMRGCVWSDVVAALSAVMPRFMRGIQYAAASRLKYWRLWNTGSPDQVGR